MNFSKLEEEILAFWRREKVFEQSLTKKGSKRPFVFYEGPPSANAKPGIHHVLARAFKDLIPRFKTMQGFAVARRAGWDTHGLPIEVQAEKELGLKNKKDIERYGVAKFNAFCRELVFRYQKEWEELTQRVGFWLDLEHPYITYENEYIEKLWGIIKQFHEKDLLYKDYKVLPYCPRCGTSLSSHEVAQGYKQVTGKSIYVRFKLKNDPDTSFLVWTTTPWTLPANLAIAVAPNMIYATIQLKTGEKVILAKERLSIIGEEYKVLEEFSGKDLEKMIVYNPPFPKALIKPLRDLAFSDHPSEPIEEQDLPKHYPEIFKVYTARFVSTSEGTGIVHIAPMYGEEDKNVGKERDLPLIHTVDLDGRIKQDLGIPGAGKIVKEADLDIIQDLNSRGLIYKQDGHYIHDYPFCWRCEEPLLYYAKSSWFVKMSSLRGELIKNNSKVTWVPDHLRDGRFGEFLKEVKDWAFSRERYWGTPLPVWMCKNGHVKVIGSVQELKTYNLKLKTLEDLHRPFIDEITFECDECKQIMRREPYVVDVWFDSGAMPYASGEKQAGRFPADFIAEGIDQTRGWFYTLLAVSTALGDGPSFKSVISSGLVLDEQGSKMSKSKGNVIEPMAIINKHGADALRWYFYVVNQPGDNKSFSEKDLATYKNKTLGLLWNIYNYYETYSKTESEKLKVKTESEKFKILDDWISARLNETIKQVTEDLEQYRVTEAARAIMLVIDDTSTWFVRRSRKRTDSAFFYTLNFILETTARLLAPFMPFNSEMLYRKLGAKSSVHLEEWPTAKAIDNELIAQMEQARAVASQAHRQRKQATIAVRQPLAKLTIPKKLPAAIAALVADEVNVKEVVVGKKLVLDTALTGQLKTEGLARELTRMIQDLRKQAGYLVGDTVTVYAELGQFKPQLTPWLTHIALDTRSKIVQTAAPANALVQSREGLTIALPRGN